LPPSNEGTPVKLDMDSSNSNEEYNDYEVETIDSNKKYGKNDLDRLIEPHKDRYPYSIVWTTLPMISCCIPVIGHTVINLIF